MPKARISTAALDTELCAWAAEGRTATLWWRDDDAVADSPALMRLLELATRFDAPLALAIVPRLAEQPLVEMIGAVRAVTPIIHGYAHINHAPAAEKQAEFGAHRAIEAMRNELGEGLSVLRAMFGARLMPVLAPPWNRLADDLYACLAPLGYCGVSAFRPAFRRIPAPGLVQTNCHIDAIDWRGQRGQRPVDAVLDELTLLLRLRRLHPHNSPGAQVFGKALPIGFDPDEPTGILTHHLVQDAACWEFLSHLLAVIAPHCRPNGGARWLTCAQAFKLDVATAV